MGDPVSPDTGICYSGQLERMLLRRFYHTDLTPAPLVALGSDAVARMLPGLDIDLIAVCRHHYRQSSYLVPIIMLSHRPYRGD